MGPEQQFFLNQKLKCLCKVSMMHFLLVAGQDNPQKVLIAFYMKAIDLFDGIIQLYKANLDECAQALIRVLFETYLKYKEFLSIVDIFGEGNAQLKVLESMMIMKEKHAREQDMD